MSEPGGKKKSVPTNTTNNKHLQPIADNIYREFWHSLPVSPFDHQLFSFFVIFLFEERLITPHFRGDLLLENVYPQIHL